MSAQPKTDTPAPDLVNIEINGKSLDVPKGSVIIQAADKAGIPIPRFCYHRKLTTAANCRQCMVEVEMGGKMVPKPQVACATPVADGMKVFTKSDNALHWQRNVMEFELINHPLDCPICDQGGECELQDLALGFGRSVNRFTERKRTLADENIGPLVATYMTRCIYCTRCVRFLDEVAGTPEFGSLGRGEHVKIGTYIGKSVESELSGNIIDVCPVGALTNKVFEMKARPWELIARASIGYHDALGANQWLHTLRGRVLRVVPRDNESINECWLSDRDRYSHEGLSAADRVNAPMVKRDGQWQDADWVDALSAAATILRDAGGDLGVLVQPASSCEEGALLARLATALGTPHIDHRLRQIDFADNPAASVGELPAEKFGHVDAALLVGSNLRHEMPLLNSRLRQASLGRPMMQATSNPAHYDTATRSGAAVHVLNPRDVDFNYKLAGKTVVAPQAMVDATLGMAAAALELAGSDDSGLAASLPRALREAMASVQPDAAARAAVAALHDGASAVVVLGEMAALHPQASWLRAGARFVAAATGAAWVETPLGANAVGLTRAGVLPGEGGLDAHAMLEQPRKAYVLFGAEPPEDFADSVVATKALDGARVVAFAAFASDALKRVADVILPISLLPETQATLVNIDGQVQDVGAAVTAPGAVRPGWKVLRALGGTLDAAGFDFVELAELRQQIAATLQSPAAGRTRQALAERPPAPDNVLVRLATVPIYRGDAVLRRAGALNAHALARAPSVAIHPDDAARLQLAPEQQVVVAGNATLPLEIDDTVPAGTVWIEYAHASTAGLPPYGAVISLDKA